MERKMQKYRVEWSLSGEHQIPPGLGARGFGEPLSLKEAQDIVRFYQSESATHHTWLKCRDFNKIVGLTHRVVLCDLNPQVEVPMGISLQGMRDIVSVLGGKQALTGVSTGEVFRRYAEATKLEDPVSPLTQAVRNMLKNP